METLDAGPMPAYARFPRNLVAVRVREVRVREESVRRVREELPDFDIETLLAKSGNPSRIVPGKWYYWHDETGTIVIYNPNNNDHGTCFRPTNGKTYYDNQN